MGRKGSGEKAQSLDPRKAGLEGGAEKGRERGTGMEIKNSKKEEYVMTVMKDNRGEKENLKDVAGGTQPDSSSTLFI